MTKEELISIVSYLPDNTEIDFIVDDGYDNWEAGNMSIDMYGGDVESKKAELSISISGGYKVSRNEGEEINDKISLITEEMASTQSYVGSIIAQVPFNLSEYVGIDTVSDIDNFISECRYLDQRFTREDIHSVIIGVWPIVNGIDIMSMRTKPLEMEIKHRYKRCGSEEENRDVTISFGSTEEAFIYYFKKYDNGLKYCNDDSYSIVDDNLRSQYSAWLTKRNYAKHGGDMY